MRNRAFVDWATQAYLVVVGMLILLFHNGTVPHWEWLVLVHALLVLVIEGLIRGHARCPQSGPLSFFRHFYPLLLYIGLYAEIGFTDRLFFQEFQDASIMRWEQAVFGCQPCLAFMSALPYPAVSEVLYAAYFSFYLMILGMGVALFVKDREQFFHFVSVMSFVFYVCYLIYLFVPIAGPLFLFVPTQGFNLPPELSHLALRYPYPAAVQHWPFFQLMAWFYRGFDMAGAALPSSHVAIAFCTVSFSFRYLRPVRFIHLAAAVLLAVATVYCRYHYVLDALGGLAAAAVLVPLGNWLYFKTCSSTSRSPSLSPTVEIMG